MLVALGTLGCYAEPFCTVDGLVQGSFSGQIAWRGKGEGECEHRYDSGFEIGVGNDRLITYQSYDGTPPFAWAVGQYGGMRVVFQSAGKEWSADECFVTLTSVTREDWTQSDYLLVTGTITCPTLTSDAAAPISLVGVAFSGYFIEGL